MNAREAIKVLADGGKVVDSDGDVWSMDDDGKVRRTRGGSSHFSLDPSWGPFTLHVEPATDEELIAEMERRATSLSGPNPDAALAFIQAADMLRTRRVRP